MLRARTFSLPFPFVVRLRVAPFLLALLIATNAKAQTAENLAQVKRVAIDWNESAKGSSSVRDRAIQKLNSSRKLQLVGTSAEADAVLHASAVIWTTGYTSTSPRSSGVQRPNYQGYAAADLNGKNGKVLWSYLVTPRPGGWKSITDDLADQLAVLLLEAISKNEPHAGMSGDSSVNTVGNIAASLDLQGAGATFPAPLYQKWFENYHRARPDAQIHYEGVGSEEGVRRLLSGTVDFGASDMPLSEAQLQSSGKKYEQFATVLGAVVPIYNVQGAPDGLNLTPEVLAEIFLGKIRSWNAQEIRSINKHAHLPDEPIVVIHRSDGSGTTFALTDYLSKISAEWKISVGMGTKVNWPVGVGAERNQGVADAVAKTPNSIGYVEYIYALQHELSFASVRNQSGEFVKADLDSVTAAARTALVPTGGNFQFSISNAGGKHTYPIATFTWILIPRTTGNPEKREAMRDLLRWMLTAGQRQCESLGYAPLPSELAARELQALSGVK